MFGRVCSACGEFVESGSCPCRGQRPDGRIVDERRLQLEAVWNSPRWKALSRRLIATAIAAGVGCVDCHSLDDLVADHRDGFTGPDDPAAWDESAIDVRCRRCSGRKDGGRRVAARGTEDLPRLF